MKLNYNSALINDGRNYYGRNNQAGVTAMVRQSCTVSTGVVCSTWCRIETATVDQLAYGFSEYFIIVRFGKGDFQ